MIKVKASDVKTGNVLDEELRWSSGREGQRMFVKSFMNRDESPVPDPCWVTSTYNKRSHFADGVLTPPLTKGDANAPIGNPIKKGAPPQEAGVT